MPVLPNLRRAGQYLMEDLLRGGLRSLLNEITPLLIQGAARSMARRRREHRDAKTTTPTSFAGEKALSRGGLAVLAAISPPTGGDQALAAEATCASLRSGGGIRRLCRPAGANRRPTTSRLTKTPCGEQNAGRWGRRHAGVGQLPIPKKAPKKGVRDMVRISDARMSGTPTDLLAARIAEANRGPLAWVRDGDLIERRGEPQVELKISDAELQNAARIGSRPSHYGAVTGPSLRAMSPRPTRLRLRLSASREADAGSRHAHESSED